MPKDKLDTPKGIQARREMMGDAETKIDGTGEEEVKEPTIDPETGEVTEAEEGAGAGAGEGAGEEGNEGEDNWEKRYKDLQSHSDKTIADKDKELTRHKDLVAPFAKNVKEREDGRLEWDFPETSKPEDKEVPEQATDEEWIDNPKAASEKDWKYREYLRNKDVETKADQKAGMDAAKEYDTKRNADWDKVQVEYPDMTDKESPLFKRATALLQDDPGISASPFCNRIVTKLAAGELGIQPVKAEEKEAKPGKKKDGSYIIGPGKGSGGGKGSGKTLSEKDFAELGPEAQREYMQKDFDTKTGD